uniref:Uncharacterized protein n=2 Tax=Histophilus somni TaxID=731 RepID=Q0I4L1_HISS1
MSNKLRNWYKRTHDFAPYTRADGKAVSDEFDAIQASFEKIPAMRDDGLGFAESPVIPDPTQDNHPVPLHLLKTAEQSVYAARDKVTELAQQVTDNNATTEQNTRLAIQSNEQAQQAKTEASQSATQATKANRQAQQAKTEATEANRQAQQAKTEASQSATQAQQAKTEASQSATQATKANRQAQQAKTEASQSATQAQQAKTEASQSATQATEVNRQAQQAKTEATEANRQAQQAKTKAENAERIATSSIKTVQQSAIQATQAENLAKKWASNPQNQIVQEDKYSAYHYALEAEKYAEKVKATAEGRKDWQFIDNVPISKDVNDSSETNLASAFSVKTAYDRAEKAKTEATKANRQAQQAKTEATEANRQAQQAKTEATEAKRQAQQAKRLAESKQSPKTTLAGYGITDFQVKTGSGDLNDYKTDGHYYFAQGQNLPDNSNNEAWHIEVISGGNPTAVRQIAHKANDTKVKTRFFNGSKWTEWKDIGGDGAIKFIYKITELEQASDKSAWLSANQSAFNLATQDILAMNALAKSPTAMSAVLNSSTAMNALANSPTAMNAVLNSPTAMNAVLNSSTAMNALANSPTAMNAVLNSPTAMNAVLNSSTAMNALANSPTAMNAVAKSSTAMSVVVKSATARKTFMKNNTVFQNIKRELWEMVKTNWKEISRQSQDNVSNANNAVANPPGLVFAMLGKYGFFGEPNRFGETTLIHKNGHFAATGRDASRPSRIDPSNYGFAVSFNGCTFTEQGDGYVYCELWCPPD